MTLAVLGHVACGGPIALDQAIRIDHSREYADMMVSASKSTPGDAWYAWQAQRSGMSVDAVRRIDAALSTARNPFSAKSDPDAVSRGAVIYRENCARCHGLDVRGNGPDLLASHPTKDFHSFAKRFAVTLHGGAPRTWFKKISEGYGDVLEYHNGPNRAMPAFGNQLAREQIWLVITYLQSLDMHAIPGSGAGDNR